VAFIFVTPDDVLYSRREIPVIPVYKPTIECQRGADTYVNRPSVSRNEQAKDET